MKELNCSLTDARICTVLPLEYNRIVARTGNKSLLLWQKCGRLLQHFRERSPGKEGFVLVDRHGGRLHYRKLLLDAFPESRCDVEREDEKGSVYRLQGGGKVMWVAFKNKADSLALPVSLASMLAKYVRELYMMEFNSYWCSKMEGLKPTAGYAGDARRFLEDVRPLLTEHNLTLNQLVRQR